MSHIKFQRMADIGTVSGFLYGYQAITGMLAEQANGASSGAMLLYGFLLVLGIAAIITSWLIGRRNWLGLYLGLGIWSLDLLLRIVFIFTGVATVSLFSVFSALLSMLMLVSISGHMGGNPAKVPAMRGDARVSAPAHNPVVRHQS